MLYLMMVLAFIASIVLTPVVKRIAFRVGAVDRPNYRKVHARIMPRLGGLAIFGSFLIAYFTLKPQDPISNAIEASFIPIETAIILGALLIIITGVLDDMYEISAKAKLIGQLVAAGIVVVGGGLEISFINLPFGGVLDFGYFSIPLTILWIVGITNAINLIDGLDGLAAGVSTVALLTLAAMAFIMGDVYVMSMAALLAASTSGFLVYNFHPAKIFMGDTGALFLGFMISVLALMGFKNVTVVALIIPIIMLGVPISDTFFAIVRRVREKKSISEADKSHLHHCLLNIGFSHSQTVLIIYGIAALFGLAALLFSQSTLWGGILLLSVMLLAIELFVEVVGLAGKNYRPLLNLVRLIGK
ncbi:MAG: undecaprenyl/decaprenyl-phosphate alpha-N-acetylglucosaminyl 1-phosphate transferase [Planococcus sp. (in: firmicutes)]|uniref:glycosyltransferase family 4 protein n=1 Tax=Planococcus halocryophilus TaxID=1215089 RepID=UPI001F0E12D4|nr:undecaprenyl/decaprenyl-phosphate alpha-N-acetylglucosaminyl 1-phosphate transferase [Planococcus halocryophilus]MCH4824764.1 undecaprenyl/decaprenyl-phosphate alpha-N-acetylglucosaminyl 1-phosphate transferase [Planococcus halocryophilus]